MLAIDMARQWHEKHGDKMSFDQLVASYMNGGLVWSVPESFLLAQPVCIDFDNRDIRYGKGHAPNAWFVHLAAGFHPLQQFVKVMPYELPYVAWTRGKYNLRVWKTSQFRSKIYGRHKC